MSGVFIGVRVPAELKKRLEDEAAEKSVSLSEHLRAYLETEWAGTTATQQRGQEARWSGQSEPVRKTYEETGQPESFKRMAVDAPNPDEIRAKAKALVASKGLRYRVAYAQVLKEVAES